MPLGIRFDVERIDAWMEALDDDRPLKNVHDDRDLLLLASVLLYRQTYPLLEAARPGGELGRMPAEHAEAESEAIIEEALAALRIGAMVIHKHVHGTPCPELTPEATTVIVRGPNGSVQKTVMPYEGK